MNVAVIADDLTGAGDSGVGFTQAGYRTAVAFRGAPIPPSGGLDATVVDTDSRLLPVRDAVERVREAGWALKEARIVFKKIDSTLRGPVAAEVRAALEATSRSKVVVAPAFPSAGRSTVEGIQLLHGEPVHETRLKDDPQTPVREGHIPSILAGAMAGARLERVATLGSGDLVDPERVRRVFGSADCVVADAEEDRHLEALVRGITEPAEVLWVGSAGLARALGSVYPGPYAGEGTGPPSRAVRRVLTVVGSTNEVVREQLRRLAGEPRVVSVPLDASAVSGPGVEDRSAAIRDALETAREALGGFRSALLYTTVEGDSEGGDPERLVAAVAEVVGRLSEERLFEALVLTGGDTAVNVARSLGARGILLEREVETGVPVGTLIGPTPYPVVTKAGGFGGPETLLKAHRMLTGKE